MSLCDTRTAPRERVGGRHMYIRQDLRPGRDPALSALISISSRGVNVRGGKPGRLHVHRARVMRMHAMCAFARERRRDGLPGKSDALSNEIRIYAAPSFYEPLKRRDILQ